MTQQYTPAQLEAWAGLGPWRVGKSLGGGFPAITKEFRLGHNTHITGAVHGYLYHADQKANQADNAALIAAAPDLAHLVLEKEKEIARLKGLAWIAFHEFNAINARSGGPLDQYGMVTVTHEYWQAITDLFAKAAGETTPWPTENAKAIFEEINRQAMKETSDGT